MKTVLALFLTPLLLTAAPLRVVTFNIETERDQNGDLADGLNEPGTEDYEAVLASLARIDADVVCLQELNNSDVSGGTQGGTNSDVHALASELGLDHVYIPSTALDFQLRNAILSRYPLLDADGIGTSDYMATIGAVGSNGAQAKDVTRAFPAVVVDVPGAAQPATIITLHNKASTDDASKFRRAVELARLADYLTRNALDESDNIVILGDFNLSGTGETFTNEPGGLPSTYNRGADIPLPITYSTDPDFYFPTPWQASALDARAVDGSDDTFLSSAGNGSTLDYILTTPAMVVEGAEIYRSDLDTTNNAGLPKVGNPLPATTSAVASDHFPVFVDLVLEDLFTGPSYYEVSSDDTTISEGFDSFSGYFDPPRWTGDNLTWRGSYSGSEQAGSYVFGSSSDPKPGIVPGPSPSQFETRFRNEGSSSISAVRISYEVEQWRIDGATSPDTLTATLTLPGQSTLPLGELTYEVAGSASPLVLETIVDHLAWEPGEELVLTLTATKGASNGPVSDDVFVNEIHYDNASGDEGEFIEVITAPGFSGSPSTVELSLYNGSNGEVYQSHLLDTFQGPNLVDGYSVYWKEISGIQNGAPDGFALTVDGVIKSFLSYEGTFTATDGPALGLTADELPASQSSALSPGVAALGFTGAAADSGEASWIRFGSDISHSPGMLNEGQTLTGAAVLPSQAISFDDLTLTVLPDTDGDGLPDLTDPDDDNDNLTDEEELALGTNPLLTDTDENGTADGDEDADRDGYSNAEELRIILTDPTDFSSRFTVTVRQGPAGPEAIFPTLLGRQYEIFLSDNLETFEKTATIEGDGTTSTLLLPTSSGKSYLQVRVNLSI
ncbi:MAG: endonuclease/exonuclease/phosphatase family protein [Verrucomicrobiota bacterium JB023]|nr:endonuclease/exonuclease/phosphatase family protein [Verrucomicrobiota bacterium JB023]